MTTNLALAPPMPLPSSRLPEDLPVGLTVDDAVRIAAALDAAHAESTRKLYAHTWRVWERWCTARGVPALPAEPAALAAYLVERAATGTAVASLNMACTAIRHMHRQHGLANPAEDELVRQVRLGLRRTYGTAPRRQARPLTVPEVRQIIDAIDRSTPIGARDAAIILLGYASALRGSELVALTLDDVHTKPGGLLVSIRHSKTDQGGKVRSSQSPTAAAPPLTPSAHWAHGAGSVATTPVRSSPGSGPAASATNASETTSSPGRSATAPSPPDSTAPGSPPTPCAPDTPPPQPWPVCP